MRRLAVLGVAFALLAGTGTAIAQTAPTLVLVPSSGPSGTSVSASGVFEGHCGVRFYWDVAGGTYLGETGAARDGTYATTIDIPTATVGDHLVVAVGLTEDPDVICSVETTDVVPEVFSVTASSSGLTADLRLSSPDRRPGEGVILDAGGSTGDIATFDFDLDGNGSYETSCGAPRAAAVHNRTGSQVVGLRVVTADGQVATDTAVLEISGNPVPPPPDPEGGSLMAFQRDTVVGTCVAENMLDLDAILKAWMCPETVMVGVAEAMFRKWGINPAAPDACFERHEEALFTKKIVFFVASKNASNAVGNPVLVNGLEFDHPVEIGYPKPFYANEIMLIETFPMLGSYGPYGFEAPKASDFRITVLAPGYKTSFASEPFSLLGNWDISDPGVVGSAVMGKTTYLVNNEFLGLKIAKKLTPISFTADRRAKLKLHLALPLSNFALAAAATSAMDVVTENNGGHPTALPSAATARSRSLGPNPPSLPPLTFTGVKLGIFTLNATLAYKREGASDVWSGGMELVFPGGAKVDGAMVIRDGDFESAHVGVGPGPPIPPGGLGPIGCCVWVYYLFGDLTPLYVGVGADFGIGPTVPIVNVPAAQVTGQAKIFYGDPWAFVLSASGLKIAGIPVNANAQVVIKSSGFLASAFVDEDWGVLDLQANVEASVTSSSWFAGGGGTACIDIEVLEGCGGGWAAVGKQGIAACAQIPYVPDGGVALGWGFFTGDLLDWSMWWGCSFGGVKGEVGARELARARTAGRGLAEASVDVEPGLPKALFAIQGEGAAPKVTLTDPEGMVIASTPGEAFGSGPGWNLVEVPHDDTTYVSVEAPVGGTWQVVEQEGSAPIVSIGLAEGLPEELVTGGVDGRGRTRTFHYEVADVPGVKVTFVERGGDPASEDPGERLEQIIGSARGGGAGDIRFTPVEGSVRARTIEAVISVDGIPGPTQEVASFTAPALTPLPAPAVEAHRRGEELDISWTRVPGAASYRVAVSRSDGPDEAFDVPRGELEALVDEITALTRAVVTVRAVSPDGYFGEMGKAVVRALPAFGLPKGGTVAEILEAGGFKASCVGAADGECGLEVLADGKVVARGTAAVAYGDVRRFLATLTAAGKRLLQNAGRKLVLDAVVTVPGRAPALARIVLSG